MSRYNSPSVNLTTKELEDIRAHREESLDESAPQGLQINLEGMYDDQPEDIILHDQKAMGNRIEGLFKKIKSNSLNDRVLGDNDPAALLEQATAEMNKEIHQDDFEAQELNSDISDLETPAELTGLEEDDMANDSVNLEYTAETIVNIIPPEVNIISDNKSDDYEDNGFEIQDEDHNEEPVGPLEKLTGFVPINVTGDFSGLTGDNNSEKLNACMMELENCKKIIQIQAKNLEDAYKLLSEAKNQAPPAPRDNNLGEVVQLCNEYAYTSNLPSHADLWSMLNSTLNFKTTNPFRADVANGVMSLMLAKYNRERHDDHLKLMSKTDALTRSMDNMIRAHNTMSEDISSLHHALVLTNTQQDQLHTFHTELKTTISNLVAHMHIVNTGMIARSLAPTITPVKTDFKPADQAYKVPTAITPDDSWKDLHIKVCNIELKLTGGKKIMLAELGKLLRISADRVIDAVDMAKQAINDPSWTDNQLLIIIGSTFAKNRQLMKELVSLYATEIKISDDQNIPARSVLDFFKKRAYKNPHPDTQPIFLTPRQDTLREVTSNRSIHPSEPQGLYIG